MMKGTGDPRKSRSDSGKSGTNTNDQAKGNMRYKSECTHEVSSSMSLDINRSFFSTKMLRKITKIDWVSKLSNSELRGN